MNLVLQNTKDYKEVRQFIRGLHYVYDSIAKKEKKVYLYISKNYIALVNDFAEPLMLDYKVCLCVLRSNMFRIQNIELEGDDFSLLYRIDADLMIKFLNSHVEPEITQVIIKIPRPSEGASYLEISYDSAEGVEGVLKMLTQYQNLEWMFSDGKISELSFNNSKIQPLFLFPPKFPKTIDYAKKYPDVWFALDRDGIKVKKTEGDQVIKDHFIRKEEFPHYNFIAINEFLQASNNICVRTAALFHHLELANRDSKKTEAKLCAVKNLYGEEESIKRCFLILQTLGEKREIYEMYEVSASKSVQFTYVEEPKRMKMTTNNRITKKEEGPEDDRTIFNRLYHHDYQEQFRFDMADRDGILRNEGKDEQPEEDRTVTANKYKIKNYE